MERILSRIEEVNDKERLQSYNSGENGLGSRRLGLDLSKGSFELAGLEGLIRRCDDSGDFAGQCGTSVSHRVYQYVATD